MKDYALAYGRRGLPVIPLHWPLEGGRCSCGRPDCHSTGKHPRTEHGLLDATTDEEQIERWWSAWPEANIGIATGAESGLVVLDVDSEDGEEALRGRHLPVSPVVQTARGLHRYFRHPSNGHRIKSGKLLTDCDLKADGGFVCAPPSLHSSGKRYDWHEALSLDDVPLPDCPVWLLDLASEPKAESVLPAGHCEAFHEGERNERLTSLAGSLRRQGLSEEVIAAQLLDLNRRLCDPPLDEGEVRRIAESIGRYEPAVEKAAALTAVSTSPVPHTEAVKTHHIADALTLEHYFAKDIGGRLYVYRGGRYCDNGREVIAEKAKRLLREWQRPESWTSYRVREVESFIAADAPELWTRPPMETVNLANGLLDVQTRELRPHSPDFLSPVQIPVAYDPEARPEALPVFFEEVFPADCAESLPWQLIAWLMTPYTGLQKAVLLLGERAAGKSTFLAVVQALLGRANYSTLSLHSLESNRFAVARLVGKLANICADLPAAHLVGTSVFKSVTGEDDVEAERKMEESFSFRPFTRLVFSANLPPQSPDGTSAFFDRWLVVPFERSFAGVEAIPRDKLLPQLTSAEELSGALNKALDHLPMVLDRGIPETESMKKASSEFREVTDPIQVWVNDNCTFHSEAVVSKAELLRRYNESAKAAGRSPMTATAFGLAVKRAVPHGIGEAKRTIGGNRALVWSGLSLRSDRDE